MTTVSFHAKLTAHLTSVGVALSCLALTACGTLDNASNSILSVVTPYKAEVVQGNVVTKEQVALLKPGLSKLQVRQLLGTPLVNSVFHADRWDYVFTINRQGTEPQKRKLTLIFNGERLEKFSGDPMPSEEEFIASITKEVGPEKVVRLEATPEELAAFKPANDAAKAPAPLAPPNVTYPPLESGVSR